MKLSEISKLDNDFKEIIKKYILKLGVVVIIFILISFTRVYPTRLIGLVVDAIKDNKGVNSNAVNLIYMYIFIRIISLILTFLSNYFQEVIKSELENLLRVKAVDKLISRDILKLKDLQSTQYVTRIFEAIEKLVEAILNMIDWIGSSMATLIFTFYFLFKINKVITLSIIPFIVLMAIFTKNISKKQKNLSKKEVESKSIVKDLIQEIVSSFEVIKIFNCKNYMVNKYNNVEQNWKKDRIKFNVVSSLSLLGLSSFGIIITAMILLIAVHSNGVVKPGDITSLLLYSGSVFVIIMEVFNNIIIFNVLESSLKRFNDIFNEELSENQDIETKIEINNWKIKLNNVSFSYKNNAIIKGLSLEIPYGKKVAIVGKNGVGKSTLLKLISGLYTADTGVVQIDGIDINKISSNQLRENISYGLQEPYIYNDTVLNNICLGEKYAEKDILSACEVCNVLNDINNLENSFETKLNENGKNLSGGQKQKIGLVRAVIRTPKLLLLDEFTNSLDVESQNIILNKLINTEKTIIFVTHDFELIQKLDYIIFIDDNRMFYIGTHEELLSKYEEYRKLIND